MARDERNVVPLAATPQRILSITFAAINDPIAGAEFNRQLQQAGHTVLQRRADARSTAEELKELQAQAETAQSVVVSLYLSPLEGSGSVQAHGAFPAFLQKLVTLDKPVVLISQGSPYAVSAAPVAPAFLLAWGGGETSQRAAARALLGTAGITGRLPNTIAGVSARGSGITRQARQ